MGLDEKLFSFVHRYFKKLRAPPPPPNYEYRAELAAMQSRLHIVARSLCAEPIQILPSENLGGFADVHFYYPRALFLFPTRQKNEQIYLQRTVFYYFQKKMNLFLSSDSGSKVSAQVYSCLAVDWAHKRITTEFPTLWTNYRSRCLEYHELIKEKLRHSTNTQNGLLALWVSSLLLGDDKPLPWCPTFEPGCTDTGHFCHQAENIYQQYFSALPEGPPLSDEVFMMWGRLMEPTLNSQDGVDQHERLDSESLAKGTEVPGKSREELVQVKMEKREDEKNPVMHSFEKIETLEEYDGGLRTQDGDDSLQEHAEALDELNIKEVTRSRERTQSLYKADIRIHSAVPEILAGDLESCSEVFYYPEWDYSAKSYRPNWCRVEVYQSVQDEAYKLDERYFVERKRILKLLNQVRHRPMWQKRQLDGVELDIEAAVNRYADVKSGRNSDDRLYLRKKKSLKDFQCLLLIDSSLSTDSWVANERVLDVIKNSVALIAEAFDDNPEAIAVAAFHSNTRHQCSLEFLKDFEDSTFQLKRSLSRLEPCGYTRIGPALRHSLKVLNESSARQKMIILLSDGKASDYDRYEGRYGMEDIKQTLREAKIQGVHVKCLAIEENAKFYLPQMFGNGNVQILSSPRHLPLALTSLFLPLLR